MVRKANQQDLPALAGLGARLWPGHTPQQLADELAGTMSGVDACFFLKLEGRTPQGREPRRRRRFLVGALFQKEARHKTKKAMERSVPSLGGCPSRT